MIRATPLKLEDLPKGLWSVMVPIRFGDCDPAGIVYTPVFFNLFNGVVEDWFCDGLGIDYHSVHRDRRTGLGYAQASCQFFTPCTHGERLTAFVRVGRIGNASLGLTVHAMKDGEEALRCELVIVTTSLDDRRAVPIPEDIRNALRTFTVSPQADI